MKKHTNIYRIDIEATEKYPDRHPTHGWQVRIRRQGQQHTKFFSDDRFGGKEAALKESVRYRDELLKTLPDPDDPSLRSAQSRSKTGVIGLNFCMKDDGSGKQKPYIQLSWLTDDGARKSASYSVDKWGLRRALWNACTRLSREKDDPSLDPYEMFRVSYTNIVKQENLPLPAEPELPEGVDVEEANAQQATSE